jgi:two-component system, sporulation sensor kinase A
MALYKEDQAVKDATDKKIGRMLDIHTQMIQSITRGDSLSVILETLTNKLEMLFHREVYCAILLAESENKLAISAAPNLPQKLRAALNSDKVGAEDCPCGRSFFSGKPFFSNIEHDSCWRNYRDEALLCGLRGCWSIPIHIDGRPAGTFAIYHREACLPEEEELEFLQTLANLAGLAIERDERIKLENRLKESEQRFKSLFDYYPDSIYMLSQDGNFVGFNRETSSIFGHCGTEMVGKSFLQFVESAEKQRILQHFQEAKQGKVQHTECRILHKNGRISDMSVVFIPIIVKNEVAGVFGISRDITYEKKLEKDLRSHHGEIAALLKRHQGLIAKFKKIDGQFVYTMGAGQLFEKLGLRLEDCIGRPLTEVLPQSVCTKVEPFHEQAWNGNDVCCEGEMNGICYVSTFSPVFQDEQVTEVIVSCSDVTELRRTHEDLRAAKELLESFVNNSLDAIATMDTEGRISFVNRAYTEMFGFKASDVLGQKIVNVPLDYQEEFNHLFQKVATGSKVQGYETLRKKADGTLIPVSITHSPIKDRNGRITGVSGIIRDITEQKRIEQEFEENRQRYQSLFDSNPDLVSSLDIEGRITNINPSVQKITGYSTEQAKGKSYIEFVAPSTLHKSTQALKKALKGKPQTFEGELVHRNGRKGIFQITHVPIIVNGSVVGIYAISKDITAKKKAEEYFRKNERISAIGQLAAGIAHEIRNPLTSLKGFMQLLEEKSDEKEYYQIMLREMERLELITDEFLILAKPQAKKYSVKDIPSILEDFLPLVETQANLNNVKIITNIENHLLPICCDINQMKQVFLNVVKNAIESMTVGGEIFIDVKRKEDSIHISIEDQGCGIPPRRLKRIWEPFYSTKEKGTGLGLMIIFNIIKEHRGDIQIDSELGKGTTVKITLPVAEQRKILP